MSPIFRRGTTAPSEPSANLINKINKASSSRKRAPSDTPTFASSSSRQRSPDKHNHLRLPIPADLLQSNGPPSPSAQSTRSTRSTTRVVESPVSQKTARSRFDDNPSVEDFGDNPTTQHSDWWGHAGPSDLHGSPRSGSIQMNDCQNEQEPLAKSGRESGDHPDYGDEPGSGLQQPHEPNQQPSHPQVPSSSQSPGRVMAGRTSAELSLGGFAPEWGSPVALDDILDPAAPQRHLPRQGSASGQAGTNIAPWLEDTHGATGSDDIRQTAPPHDVAVPDLTRAKRQDDPPATRSSHSSAITSTTSRVPSLSGTSLTGRSRQGSQESVQTLAASQRQTATPPANDPGLFHPGGGRHPSMAGRVGRYGSTASNISGSAASTGSDRKKGFLGGLLKRKTGGQVSQAPPDFSPIEGPHRGSASGSASSRLSTSTSYSSLSAAPPTSQLSPVRSSRHIPRQNQSFASDGAISPLHEIGEPEFTLDMNLDDMEGIVDPNVANGPAAVPPRATGSDPSEAMIVQDALNQTSSFATSQSGSSGSADSGPGAAAPRIVTASAERVSDPFSRVNPFGSPHGSIASLEGKPRTPPSPHTLVLSARHPSAQPRRPSQLRNMQRGSVDSDTLDSAALQPLAPAWAQTQTPGPTLFNDPFESGGKAALGSKATADASQTAGSVAGVLAGAAAWAAPESWGVEADEEDGGTTSSDEDDWKPREEELPSPPPSDTRLLQPSLSSTARKPPPFGFKSAGRDGGTDSRPGTGSGRKRVKTSSGRPGSRPPTATRPGTSGSAHVSTVPHHIRIYRADGSYTSMEFPINTTVAEILNALSGVDAPGKKATTNMKLYLRTGGQDRQLLPSEKPLAIQDRRLRQAGYTDLERLEELGKEDLFILCKFIHQTPNLPVMNPEEETSYDSFELIDVAGRDLLTIPIFLHLHAHNIIILNVSRNPMTDIPLDFIQACTALKELRMSYMALKRIPASICASTTLSRLDVSCNRIADLENVPLHEIQTLTSLKVQNNKLASIPSYFAQMKALKYLNISNNKFDTFPAVVSEMSNLVDLDVSFNTIAELPSEMSNLKSLERLAAFGNELTTFPASFSTLANLRSLDVRRNKLTDIDSVYALPNLTILQADNNNLVTLDAQLGAKVRQFSVPHNSITRFTLAPQSNTVVTYALTRLDLSHGKISTLADEAFSGLVNLIDLNLDFNQFTRLPSTIGQLVNLQSLSCTDNMLESMPPGVGRLQKLRVLNMHNNNLKSFPHELWALSSLEKLNVSSNLVRNATPPGPVAEIIELVGPEIAAELDLLNPHGVKVYPISRNLREVSFADNRFDDQIMHYLADSPRLRVVNVSFNDIFEIPPGTISRWPHLEELYLSGCKLTTLPSEDLEKLQKLRVLHLNGNKLQTLPSELGALVSLQHLDVGSNVLKYNIANWPYDWNWNWNTALRYLNLSGNKRLEIKPTSAQDMSHVSTFRKDLSDFTALTSLRLLGLMDVTLRIPSLPDESDEKRVRTSFSDINNMAYGISDMVGSTEHLAMFDMVVPNFRGKDNECLFGMFGRAMSPLAGKIPRFLQETFGATLNGHLDALGDGEDVLQALRRSFLSSNRATFQHLCQFNGRKQSVSSMSPGDSMFRNWSPSPMSPFRSGASGAVVYLVDKTLHVGNVGDCLVVLSRKGEAELLSKLHDPTDRDETARIRRAEAWVSTKGYVNDEKDIDISRAIGYFQHFPSVNASPEVRTRELSESDEFVIVGNYALWKCCSYQTAVDIARTERDDPMMAAQKLRDFAISYGAEGSVMVMIVNVSDLFGNRRRRGNASLAEPAADNSSYARERDKRNIRRRYEEFGDRTLNRLQQEIEPPTGQVAIVFTDIVNSTHLWETNPGMPTAIKMHHNLMRRQLRLDGGYEVKTEGDSFMVSFQTVAAALLWAFNCQIGLLREEWPRELLDAPDGKVVYDSEGNLIQRGLRVRMGVHWGAPQCERDPITRRMDYYGPMVNRAARINASADGGQLMASQDVISEIQALREYLDTLDEAGLTTMPSEMKREVAELKAIGFEVKEMGERKLKGLEVPEKLHLLYPKSLAGRFETSNELRANVEKADSRSLITGPRSIDIEEVRELSKLVLRLEALSSVVDAHAPSSSPLVSPTIEMTPSRRTHTTRGFRLPPQSFLGPHIKEDMNDEELAVVIESLTTRIENVTSTLFLKHLGGFSSVLAALEQATRIDQKMIFHAMAMMSGAMGQ